MCLLTHLCYNWQGCLFTKHDQKFLQSDTKTNLKIIFSRDEIFLDAKLHKLTLCKFINFCYSFHICKSVKTFFKLKTSWNWHLSFEEADVGSKFFHVGHKQALISWDPKKATVGLTLESSRGAWMQENARPRGQYGKGAVLRVWRQVSQSRWEAEFMTGLATRFYPPSFLPGTWTEMCQLSRPLDMENNTHLSQFSRVFEGQKVMRLKALYKP